MADDTTAIFCGNFEYTATARDIERLFERYGDIDRVEMKTGFAFIYMKDRRDADDAIRRLDGRAYGHKKRILRVERARQTKNDYRMKGSVPNNTLFVVNFDARTTRERDLENLFEPYGRIIRVNIRRNYAFIQFETVEEATEAMRRTDGASLMGRILTVEYCANDGSKRMSPRRSPGYRDRSWSPRARSPYRGSGRYHKYRGYSRSRSYSKYSRSRSRSPFYSPDRY